MLANPFALLALSAYCIACLRLLTYRRAGARHRMHVSWLAWALLVILGGSAIEVALQAKTVSIFDAGLALFLSLFIYAARGNVARLLWSQ